jgi:long-chain acyl-CoA synthetase
MSAEVRAADPGIAPLYGDDPRLEPLIGPGAPFEVERVCAVVVFRPGADVDLADLRGFASARLAGFKCPEALHVTEELPKTATGKVAKAAVRSQVADAAGAVERVW